MSINRWKNKEDVVNTYNGILLSHKKEQTNAICSNMKQLVIITLSEVNKRKTNIIWYHLHVEPKLWHKSTYLWNRNRLMNTENRLVVAKGEEIGAEMSGKFELADVSSFT